MCDPEMRHDEATPTAYCVLCDLFGYSRMCALFRHDSGTCSYYVHESWWIYTATWSHGMFRSGQCMTAHDRYYSMYIVAEWLHTSPDSTVLDLSVRQCQEVLSSLPIAVGNICPGWFESRYKYKATSFSTGSRESPLGLSREDAIRHVKLLVPSTVPLAIDRMNIGHNMLLCLNCANDIRLNDLNLSVCQKIVCVESHAPLAFFMVGIGNPTMFHLQDHHDHSPPTTNLKMSRGSMFLMKFVV